MTSMKHTEMGKWTSRFEATGSKVSMEGLLRKAGTKPMVVRIPPATLFEPNGGGVQKKVVTDGTTVDLTNSRRAAYKAAVACSDLHLSVPSEGDRFAVARLPDRKAEVVKFFPVANRAGVSYETKQAGVWIVTDDANYNGLPNPCGWFPRRRSKSHQ